jgi:hypothetical protein
MKYKVMFWAMCLFIYVGMFWVLPLAHDDSFSYLAVVLQVHIAVPLFIGVAGVFGYLADKAYNL